MKLNRATLRDLPEGILVPDYDPADVQPGVLHLGMGNFHRAHEGVYLDRIASNGDLTWGTVGVGFRAPDEALNHAAAEQDGLYTLETVSPTGEVEVRVLGNVVDHLYTPADAAHLLELAADLQIRIISLTITEAGYAAPDPVTELDPSSPGPLGTIVLAAQQRKADGAPGFTVLSCDNIQENGDLAKKIVRDLAATKGDDLVEWIDENLSFPNGMVDRITPVTSAALVEQRAADGVEDAWPVRAETYLQWVLEDDFAAGRPAWDEVGVQLVDDVRPYEKMKLRLLNASHQVLSHIGILEGMTFVDEVVTDPDFSQLVRDYMELEGRPTLDAVPGINLDEYCDQLMARFGAKATEDTLARQVVDSSERMAKFVFPALADQLASDDPQIDAIALTLAAWYERALSGEALTDQAEDVLRRGALAEKAGDGSFLETVIVDPGVAQNPLLVERFVFYRELLEEKGPREAVKEVNRRGRSRRA